MDVPGHDPYLALPGLDDPRAVGAYQTGLVLAQQRGFHPDLQAKGSP